MSLPVKMSAEEFREHCNDMDGICTSCGDIRYGDTEPDAEEYPCESCGDDAVQGMDNALIEENVEITE